MTLCQDLLNPLPSTQAKTHKLKRLVQSPNSYFMDTVVQCPKCQAVLCQPTGGLAKLSEGVSFRKKPQ
ncbi:40S ribosomal protein S27 [Actinomortierella wolfii]|nr:40S ribosomal protein S27 [Actinomortierella wolfii]